MDIMELVRQITTNRGDKYRIYFEHPNERCNRFYIKKKFNSWFFGIAYWSFIKTEYKSHDVTNHPLDFYSAKAVIDYIEKTEDELSIIDMAVI